MSNLITASSPCVQLPLQEESGGLKCIINKMQQKCREADMLREVVTRGWDN